MGIKNNLRKSLIELSGYWIYRQKELPVGCDLFTDIKLKIRLPINVAFDVGANIGQTTLQFHENFKEAVIFSFEPVAATFERLRQNTVLLKRAKPYQLALGDTQEKRMIKLFEEQDSVLNSLKEDVMNKDGGLSEIIDVQRGDTFCSENNIREIDLLKIDTEGYELTVLKGFSNMIENGKINMIYCETGFSTVNSRNTYIDSLLSFANENGYRMFGLYEVSNLHIRNGCNYGNLLLVKNEIAMNIS